MGRELYTLSYGKGGTFVKRLFSVLILALLLLIGTSVPAMALEVNATAAVLVDAATGRVIFEQNADEALAPASTTKVLTALLVLENVPDLSKTVTLPDDFANVGESSIYLEPGDTYTFIDLLHALLLRSANDAAQALAIGVAGTEAAFVDMMNVRVEELGLENCHFENPHGLDGETHLSSAYDLAMITAEATKIDLFNQIVATKEYTIIKEDGSELPLYNHNQFLDYGYEGADGVKTGYTSKSGSCLIASATRDGLRLISVVLNAQGHYEETAKMMDYGFEKYEAVDLGTKGDVVGTVRVLSGKVEEIDVLLGESVSIPMEIGASSVPDAVYTFPQTMEAPFTAEEPIGEAVYKDGENNEIKVPLYLKEGTERYTFFTVFAEIWQRFLEMFL